MWSLGPRKWFLALAAAILYFGSTPAVADCLCADIIQTFAICSGEGCANLDFNACSTTSFTSCNVCAASRRFVGCCDGGAFFQTMKSGGPCLVAGIVQKNNFRLNARAKARAPKKAKTVVLVLPSCDGGYLKLRVG